jgi:hypothetical protein
VVLPQGLLEKPVLLQAGLLVLVGVGAWTRNLRPALAGAMGLFGIQALLPGLAKLQAGQADLDTLLPVLLWVLVIAANLRRERRDTYFGP